MTTYFERTYSGMTSAQVDAHAAAFTPADSIAAVRNNAVTRAVNLLHTGHSLTAQAILKAAVEEQARLAGCGYVNLPAAPGRYPVSRAAESWASNVWQVIARRRGLNP